VSGAPGPGARRPARAHLHRLSTRIYGPRRGCLGFSWVGDERVAIGGVPVGEAVWRLPEEGVTHVVNCRAPLQARISQDLWAERRVLGPDRVIQAPMWDSGKPQPARLWSPAVEFAVNALEEDPEAGVLIHCQQGRRRSAMVAYGVLRLRGHSPEEASRLILHHRPQAHLVPVYTAGVERWLSERADALP
jgi:protein-tyrosine phosphatase